jgi:hypothetical protein
MQPSPANAPLPAIIPAATNHTHANSQHNHAPVTTVIRVNDRNLHETDFSVVLFRPNFMLLSEEHPMKSHKNQWLVILLSPPISLVELQIREHPMVSGVQTPSQCPDTGLSPEKCASKPLKTKHFHRVSAGNEHPYLLKS